MAYVVWQPLSRDTLTLGLQQASEASPATGGLLESIAIALDPSNSLRVSLLRYFVNVCPYVYMYRVWGFSALLAAAQVDFLCSIGSLTFNRSKRKKSWPSNQPIVPLRGSCGPRTYKAHLTFKWHLIALAFSFALVQHLASAWTPAILVPTYRRVHLLCIAARPPAQSRRTPFS